ncbi:hypothetical protein Tco_0532860 [Tanacetum coccineum]
MTETMEQYMSKTRENYGSGVTRPKINDKTHFELKRKFLKELRENNFSDSEHKDAIKHIEKVLEIIDLFHIPEVTQDQIMLRAFPKSLTRAASCWLKNEPSVILFYNGLDVPNRHIFDSKGAIPTKLLLMQKLAAIQAQLNNLGKEIKKVNEKVYAAQFGAPYHPGVQYRAAGPRFYQQNNKNSSYPKRRQTLEESLTKFMAKSAKRYEENSNIIKEIQASTNVAIRNQGSSIKTLEIKIGQMSKVLQERGIISLPCLTKPNPRDHVKLISTAKADSSVIRRIKSGPCVDKGDHEGKNLAATLTDIPIFVGNFSIISGFSNTDDINLTSGVVLGMPFCKKFVLCQKIMERFAHGDKCERMDEE